MAGEEYSQTITATGGTGALIFSIASGELPQGMVINATTGELTGPLDEDAEVRQYSFTIQVRDADGFTATAVYTLTVLERAVTVTDKQIEVPAGTTPNNVDLTRGATGGPFVSADVVTVDPPNAGTVSIVRGEFAQAGPTGPLGWYLKFIPNPSYSGQVSVQFRLTSALGISNTGIVTYSLGFDAGEVTAEIDELVHGFVRSRQSLIASTLDVPGLLQRRQAALASDPVTMRMSPSARGIRANVATSLIQIEAAANTGDGAEMAEISPFNIWLDGSFMLHKRDDDEDRWGSFAMISAGVDYLVSDRFLAGVSFHYDRMTDPTSDDAELFGDGWLVGPYASLEIGKGVFWDTSLLYGGSANDVDTAFWDGSFDTRRWVFDTSLKGQWQLDEATVLTPKLRAFYFSETVDNYEVVNGDGDVLDLKGFTEEQLRISLGAEIARSFVLESGSVLTPKLGITAGFSGLDGSGAFGQVSAGLSMDTADAWKLDFGLMFNIEGEGEQAIGARAGVSKRF